MKRDEKLKVASIQLNSQDNKEMNVKKALTLIEKAAMDGAKLVVLPEYFNFLGDDKEKIKHAESIPGPTSTALMEKAKELGIYIHCGSILEKGDEKRSYNTSLLIDDQGNIVATYRKIHLFDVEIEGRVVAKESDSIIPGDQVVTAVTPFGKLGFAICYDLRFPELFRSLVLKGAQIIVLPAAFTLYTGIHHWEVLLRARAIENQCYVIASGQFGSYPPNRTNFGSSMIIDPWGIVVARAPEMECYIMADIDLNRVKESRERVPCLSNRKPSIY